MKGEGWKVVWVLWRGRGVRRGERGVLGWFGLYVWRGVKDKKEKEKGVFRLRIKGVISAFLIVYMDMIGVVPRRRTAYIPPRLRLRVYPKRFPRMHVRGLFAFAPTLKLSGFDRMDVVFGGRVPVGVGVVGWCVEWCGLLLFLCPAGCYFFAAGVGVGVGVGVEVGVCG